MSIIRWLVQLKDNDPALKCLHVLPLRRMEKQDFDELFTSLASNSHLEELFISSKHHSNMDIQLLSIALIQRWRCGVPLKKLSLPCLKGEILVELVDSLMGICDVAHGLLGAVDFDGAVMNDTEWLYLARLQQFASIPNWNLIGCDIQSEELFMAGGIKFMDLSGSVISIPNPFQNFVSHDLNCLLLNNINLTREDLNHIVNLAPLLEILEIQNDKQDFILPFTDDGQCTKLRTLKISGYKLDKITCFPVLQHFKISDSSLPTDITTISSTITTLELCDVKITISQLISFISKVSLPELKTFRLYSNDINIDTEEISDTSCFLTACPFPQLEDLDLATNNISKKGVFKLKKLVDKIAPKLKYICVAAQRNGEDFSDLVDMFLPVELIVSGNH